MSNSISDSPRARRRFRNLLLDKHFQLKYTGIIIGSVMLLFAVFGGAVFEAANIAVAQARDAADLATVAEDQAERAFRETQSSSRILRMNQLAESGSDPLVVRAIEAELDQVDAHARANVFRIHAQREVVRAQRSEIEWGHNHLLMLLVVTGMSLLTALTVLGIVITHRFVGPIFHLKRLLHHVGTGRLDVHERLRRHDELVDLFNAFLAMVATMRKEQTREIAELDAALEHAIQAGAPEASLTGLRELRQRMRAVPGLDD